MGENNKNLNIKFNKSKDKITAIKPIIKLETNPEILKNLKEVFSSQKIQDQIKSAVNKLQADDAITSPNSINVIRSQKIKTKHKTPLNSVKESLRTSILHKKTNNKFLNQVKNYSSSQNINNYPETIKVLDGKHVKTFSSNNGVTKNLEANTNKNSSKMLNENTLSRNTSYNHATVQPIILNSKAYMASNGSLNNKLKSNPEPMENSQHPIQYNILNGKSPMNYELSISGNNIHFDYSKNNQEYFLAFPNSGTRNAQTTYESATESESETVQLKYNNIPDNSHKSLKKKLLPATVTTNYFTSPNKSDQPLNLIPNHSTKNLINTKRKSDGEKKFTLYDGKEEHGFNTNENPRKKINSTNIDSNKVSRKVKKIMKNELIVPGTNKIFAEENKTKLRHELSASKITSLVPPEIKIQKAAINIEGIQTSNYKVDILQKMFIDAESPKIFSNTNEIEISNTNITMNFIKKAIEKKSLFKSPENPPKNKIDDVNFQNEFLMNEIEEYKNLNKDLIKTEENFYQQNQPISFQIANHSPERYDAGCSPKLIQDLDSNTIFKQKSTGFSPKIIQNFCSNSILNNNLDDSSYLVYPSNTYHKPIESAPKELSNDLTFKNENAVDAVDFLCSLNENFEKYSCDDDEEDDLSESSFNLDESEILRPEDFLQNISKTLLNEKTSNENDLLNNVNIKNYIGKEDSNKLNDRCPSKSMPIVIENKILADDEKINLNLCLNGSVQIENLKNIVDKCCIPVTELKNCNFDTIKIEENLNNDNNSLELVNNDFERKLQSTSSITELQSEPTKILESQKSYHANICENLENSFTVNKEINLEPIIAECNKEANIEPRTDPIIIENKAYQNSQTHNQIINMNPTLLQENLNKSHPLLELVNNDIEKKLQSTSSIAELQNEPTKTLENQKTYHANICENLENSFTVKKEINLEPIITQCNKEANIEPRTDPIIIENKAYQNSQTHNQIINMNPTLLQENLNKSHPLLELVNNDIEKKLQSTSSIAELQSEPTKILESQKSYHANICENLENSFTVKKEINLEPIITQCNKEANIEPRTNPIIVENKSYQNIQIHNESINMNPTLLQENLNKSHSSLELVNNKIENKLPSTSSIKELQNEPNKLLYFSENSLKVSNEINLEPIITECNKETNIEQRTNEIIVENKAYQNIQTHNESINMNPILLQHENKNITQQNNAINEKLVLKSHELPLIEEEIIKTTNTSTNLNNLPLVGTSKTNPTQNTKPKTVQISSRRPGLKGSKINLVQRRKGQAIINKNNSLSKKPENEENPSISPHLLQENLKSTQDKHLDDTINMNEKFLEHIVDGNENISKETKLQENDCIIKNELLSSKIDYQPKDDNYNSINGLDNINVIENKNLEQIETNAFEKEEVSISAMDNSYYTSSTDLNNVTEISLSDTNINTDAVQTNNEEDVSNESDLSKSEFNGFDLSSNENCSKQTIYYTFEEIANKLMESESCKTVNEYNAQTPTNIDNCNRNIEKNDNILVISKNENVINSILSKDIDIGKDFNNIIEENIENILKTKKSDILPEAIKNENNNLAQRSEDSENVSHSCNTPEFSNNVANSKSNFCLFDTENSNPQKKISVSKDSRKKRQKTFTSDSDSFGEDDCVPLKKRPLRNAFSNNSVSESEQTRKENKIMILEKRAYFSTRKDSETSTSSDHHHSIPGLNSPNIETTEKSLENKINNIEVNKKNQISITDSFENSEIKKIKNSLEECLKTVKTSLQKESETNIIKTDDNKKSDKKVEKLKLNLNSNNKKKRVESCLKLEKNSKDVKSINDIPEKAQVNLKATIEKKLTTDEVLDTEDFVSKSPYTKEEQLNFVESKDLSKQAYTKEEQLNFIESKDLLPENNVKNSEDSKIKKKTKKKIHLNSTSSKSETISNKEKKKEKELQKKIHLNSTSSKSEKISNKEKKKEKELQKKIHLNSTSSKSETISNKEKKKEKELDGKLLETSSNNINQATPLKSDNSNTKIKKTSKSSKILKKEKIKDDEKGSESLQTSPSDILHDDFNKSLLNNKLSHFSSTPISKAKKRKMEKSENDNEIDNTLKKKKKNTCKDSNIDQTSSAKDASIDKDVSQAKDVSIDKQMTLDSFVNGLQQNLPILQNKLIPNESVKDVIVEKKKRGRPKNDLKSKEKASRLPETETNIKKEKTPIKKESTLIKKENTPIKKESAFEKFCNTLIPQERKRGRKVSTTGQRKLHPNLLIIQNRCDIETFKIDDSDRKPTSENEFVCGLCKQIVLKKSTEWTNHLITHYGIGWVEGSENIDVTQYNIVLSRMINFMKVANIKALKCRMCNTEFKSALGVLTHLLVCGLKEEDRRNETHIACEHCNKYFHFVALKLHRKTCTTENISHENENETDTDISFSNLGRYKRKSTIKAENKLKEIGNDFENINVKTYIKPILPVVRGGIYRKWKKNIESGEKVKCYGKNCEEIFDDINLLKKHIKGCKKIEKATYRCVLCKFIDSNVENVKKHVQKEHENALKNLCIDRSGSETDYSKEDGSESSEDCSSGADENEIEENEENEENKEDIVLSDEEQQSKMKKRKRVSNSVKNILQTSTQKSKNSFLGYRTSFAKVAESVKNWTKFFIANHYSLEPMFPSFLPKFELPTDINRNDYEPQNDISMKFAFSEKEVNPEFGSSAITSKQIELERFKWIQNNNEFLLYIGGPITTVQWVPLPDTISSKIQYLAISYKCNYNKFTRAINQKSHKTLILIFKLESSIKEFGAFSNLDFSVQCNFQYGIICDNGPIHDMKFLPSGGYDTSINRLGLLAVANVDNNVNIYSLPIETPQKNCDTINDNDNINLIRLKPVMKLSLSYGIEDNDKIREKKDHYFVQCHKIVWSQAKGHNMLGTGYANGYVALWNIEKECNLNCFKGDHNDETLYFTPLSYFKISDKYITNLDFHYDHKEPRWLIAGSYNRIVRIFDIENPSSPIILIDDLSQSFVTSVKWPLIWENAICSSSSDLCLAGPLTYSPMQFLFLRRRCALIPSGVTSIDFNPWTNVSIVGTENGDFTFEYRSEYNLDCTLKRYILTKSFTYTDLIKLDGTKHELVDENNVTNKKQNNNKMNKNKDIETSERRMENIEPLKFFDKDYRNKYSLVFGPLTFHKELTDNYQSEKRTPQFNLSCYVRINAVACNTNYHGSNLNAIGYENGFIRIFYYKLPKIVN